MGKTSESLRVQAGRSPWTRSRGGWGLAGGAVSSTGRCPKGLKAEAGPTVFGEVGDGKAQAGRLVLPGGSVDCAVARVKTQARPLL